MAAPKGHRIPNAPKGRKPGQLNRATVEAKQAFQAAFEGMGGVPTLLAWAQDNQTDFFKLYARLIPVDTRLSGPDGGDIPIKATIEFVDGRRPPDPPAAAGES